MGEIRNSRRGRKRAFAGDRLYVSEPLERRMLLTAAIAVFQPQQAYPVGPNPLAISVADVDRDGKQDLLVASNTGYFVGVLLGANSFTGEQTYAVGHAPIALTVADVNIDGKPDIAVANYTDNTVSLLAGNGDGTFQPQQTFAVGSNPIAVAIADVNGDGKPGGCECRW